MRGLAWDGADRIGPRRRPADRPPTPLAVLTCARRSSTCGRAAGRPGPDRNAPGGARAGARLGIPALSLVVLIGVSGSGKSTFARQHFGRFEVISSDFCRGLVADDENDQAATKDAFDVLGYIAGKRLAAGRLTVIDATNVQASARKHLVDLARAHDVLPVAIVLDVPENLCAERNASRADRSFGRHGDPPPA